MRFHATQRHLHHLLDATRVGDGGIVVILGTKGRRQAPGAGVTW